jgi:hypothetical protein
LAALDCGEYPALDSGPAGLGVFEQLDHPLPASASLAYRRFGAATQAFSAPSTVAAQGGSSTAVSQSATGAVYATWLTSSAGGVLRFGYSPDGGNTWMPATTLDDATGVGPTATSRVAADGQGWAVYGRSSNEVALPLAYTAPSAASKLKPTATTTVGANVVTLSTRGHCVNSGRVTARLTVAAHKRKAKVTVKIHQVTFSVDGKARRTLTRSHLTAAPFQATFPVQIAPGSVHTLSAHAIIAVHHGPPRSKTLRVKITACG